MECGCENIIPHPIAKCFVLAKVADSIANQEQALSCIINAECEKLKKVICSCSDVEDLLAVNNSVAAMLAQIANLENVLKDKLNCIMPCLCECDTVETGK